MKYGFVHLGLAVLLAGCSQMVMAGESVSISIGDQSGMFGIIDVGSKEFLNQMLRHEAKYGRISRIESLIQQGADVNGRAEYGETALYYSILFGRVKASLRLIELGADPNTTDDMDRTPLLKAADDCNYRIVEALLKVGANANHADYYGRTPLINAVESNCVRAVAVILSNAKGNVDLDAHDNSYRTATDYARHPWIEKMLEIAHGRIGDYAKLLEITQ
ncbi:MAG: ankyrin repeat domain-containing protein [Bdellovibrionota bacterium]